MKTPCIVTNRRVVVHDPALRLAADKPKAVIILGYVGNISAQELTSVTSKARRIYLITDLALEFVWEDHVPGGWVSDNSFFSMGIFAGEWDVAIVQANNRAGCVIGQSTN